MKFLLVKTAAVRKGVKPTELLRIRHCYETQNEDGLRICLYRGDIYDILGLNYIELLVEEGSSLLLFFNPAMLVSTLGKRHNRKWLGRRGYPVDGSADMSQDGEKTVEAMLLHLVKRTAECGLPHEVGVFIGYPLKDVAGFIANMPSTPLHNRPWRVYGDARPSIEKMRLYANAERDL